MYSTTRVARTALLLLIMGAGSFITPLHAEVVNIDVNELQKLLDSGIPIVDVRRPDEWESTGVIDQSELLTFFDEKGAYNADAWLASLDKVVSRGEPVILICRSGNRSNMITRWLSDKMGYDTVYNVTDGILSWQADGGQTVKP